MLLITVALRCKYDGSFQIRSCSRSCRTPFASGSESREERRDFQRHVTASGANTWLARSGKHDDIVLATSYGIWWAMSGPRTVIAPFPLI